MFTGQFWLKCAVKNLHNKKLTHIYMILKYLRSKSICDSCRKSKLPCTDETISLNCRGRLIETVEKNELSSKPAWVASNMFVFCVSAGGSASCVFVVDECTSSRSSGWFYETWQHLSQENALMLEKVYNKKDACNKDMWRFKVTEVRRINHNQVSANVRTSGRPNRGAYT